MEQKYYSIKEFAEMLGISQQSIYKRLKKENDPLQNYTKTEDNKTLIADSAVREVFKREVPPNIEEEKEENVSPPLNDIVILLKEQIETLKKALEGKEEEIQRLSAQNKKLYEMLENQQRMTEQQQQLSALDKKNILLLEERVSKKKGIFGWFNKKKGEEVNG